MVEKDIKEVMFEEKISEEDREAYERERGGDVHVMHMAGHKADAKSVIDGNTKIEEGEAADPDEGYGEPTLEQRARRLQRAKRWARMKLLS